MAPRSGKSEHPDNYLELSRPAAVPGIMIRSMDRTKDPATYVADAFARRVDFIQLRDCARDARFPTWISALHAAGVRINYFYANDSAETARLFAAGVDFVLVNDLASCTARP